MNYKLITENLEEIINISERSIEIIADDEVNKDNKLQVKANDMIYLLGQIVGELNKNSIKNHSFSGNKDKDV